MECSWCTQDGPEWFTRIILLKVHINSTQYSNYCLLIKETSEAFRC